MKLSRFLSNKKLDLGQQGIAHFVVPLLAVVLIAIVGTFMVVSSNANPVSKKNTASKKAATSKIGKGYLFVYGDGDRIGVQIQAVSMDTKTHSCGGSWQNGIIKKKFPNAKVIGDKWQISPARLSCSATQGNEAYYVSFLNSGGAVEGNSVAVDIDAGYCTAVRADGSQVKVKYNKNEQACGKVNESKIVKATPSIVVQPSSSNNGKKLTGWVSLVAPSITKKKCTGQVKVTISDPAVITSKNFPLKYVNVKNRAPYCVAKLNFSGLKQNVNYNVRADFAGSIFFNPMANGANITLTKARAVNNGTGGALAPSN